jgi:hypothetical protein
MKHWPSNWPIHAHPARPPLRTLREMAEELGVSAQRLNFCLKHSTCSPPAPVLKHANRPRNTWYDPVEMRAWWKRHQGG